MDRNHTDRLGHTNNVRYLEWLEQIAWEHIDLLGFGWDAHEASGRAMAIVRTEIDYRLSSYPGEQLILGTWITGSDLKLHSQRHFQLFRESDQKLILEACMRFTCINLKSGRPGRMSADLIAAHENGLRAAGLM